MKRLAVLIPAVLASLSWSPCASGAQTPEVLADRCVAAGGDPTMCTLAAAAGRDLLGAVGVLSGPGAEVPGQGSTLGRRIGGAPRFAPWIGVGGLSVALPDLGDATGTGEETFFVPAVHAGLALGLFDGFRLLPTVGGLLSLDLVSRASFLSLPQAKGFDGRADVVSIGARVGILRESFTLPGASVSVTRRFSGAFRLGDTGAGDPAQVAVDPSVTSVRATVGKDLFAFGVLAGAGWDDYSSDSAAEVLDRGGGFASATASLEASRRHYFVGLSKQLGVLSWIAGEVGWVRGFDPVSFAGSTSPERGWTLFGSLALLLKL